MERLTDVHDVDIALVQRELRRKNPLRFSGALEAAYRDDQRQRAVVAFRGNAFFMAALYLLLSSGIYMLMPAEDVGRWFGLYGWVGAIILVAQAMSHVSLLDRWYPVYVGTGSFLAVTLSVAVTGVVNDATAGSLTHAGIMYAMVIIYDLCGLRITHALIAGWGGGLAGMWLAQALGGGVDWEVLHRTYTGSSLLGMFLAYFSEKRDRAIFLQTRLLALEQARTEAYARRVEQLSREDPLSGLANRRYFDEVFRKEWQRAIRSGTPLAVLLIDIDNFKMYNDTFGHTRGDECLQEIARMLKSHVRASTDLAVRYGGEEFLLLVPGARCAEAQQIATSLVRRVRDLGLRHAPGLSRDYVSISVGVASVRPAEELPMGVLIEAADKALYRAKNDGRDTWRCSPGEAAGGEHRGAETSSRERA